MEVGLVGKLTDNWEISAGVAKMETEVERGLANQNGLQITWSPELTFTSWTTYHTPFGLSIGGGFRYVDSVIRPVELEQRAAAAESDQHAQHARLLGGRPDGGYEINEKVSLQLNAYNLTDEFYVSTLNNSGARYSPGAPRSGLLTVNFTF